MAIDKILQTVQNMNMYSNLTIYEVIIENVLLHVKSADYFPGW